MLVVPDVGVPVSRAWDVTELATRIRAYLADNPTVVIITVPLMQQNIGGAVHLPRHIVEQAFARLNKSGELSQAQNVHKCRCTGFCNASHYYVLKRTPPKLRAKQRLRAQR